MALLDWLFRTRRSSASKYSEPVDERTSGGTPAFAVLDVETTGLSPNRDRIVEFAVVRVDRRGDIVDEITSRVNPEGPVGATHIHGIRAEDVIGKPAFRDVAPTIAATLRGLPIVAHNAKFDLAFLRAEFRAAGWDLPWLAAYCTLDASFNYMPRLDRRRLSDCCWAVGTSLSDAHSALGDARATSGLLRAYIGADDRRDELLHTIGDLAARTPWPAGPARLAQSRESRTVQRGAAERRSRPRAVATSLVRQLNAVSLLEVIEEGAPDGAIPYLELMIDALEDGEISQAESDALEELRLEYSLTPKDLSRTHEALVRALAHRAVDDGVVTLVERRELHDLSALLGVEDGSVKRVLEAAEATRHARLGANLEPLPAGWNLGEPLRVGDKVVFTGCEGAERERLETRAEQLGVRVSGSVSRLTAMLVTDGSFSGGKAARARELGTRTIHPRDFEMLLRHLQPSTRGVDQPVALTKVSSSEQTGPAAASNQTIRSWALANGFEVGVRGRLPQAVITAFNADQSLSTAGVVDD